jgi:uncharacterized glyoxalase superfamily protein PhnB
VPSGDKEIYLVRECGYFRCPQSMEAKPQFQFAAPVFLVDDVVKTSGWYRDAMGFRVRFASADHGFGIVNRDHLEIHLMRATIKGARNSVTAAREHGGDLYVFVSDADEVYAELKRNGVELLEEPADQFYGMRDFRARDVNGYVIGFGHAVSAKK